MERYAEWIIRLRVLVIAVTAVVTAALAAQVQHLEVVVDTTKFVPSTHPYVMATTEIERIFGMKFMIVVGITPKEGDAFSPGVTGKVKRITAEILEMPGVSKRNVLSFAARRAKSIAGTAEGIEVRPLMERVPRDAEESAALRRAVFANPVYLNAIVSRDGRTAGILAEIADQHGYRPIVDRIRAVLDQERDGTVDIVFSGGPVYAAELERYSQRMAVLLPLAILIIGLIHYEAFRTIQGLILPLVTALLAVVWATGVMGLFGVPMDTFNATTPILILAIAAGHAVQILKRYYEEFRRLRHAVGLLPHAANRAAVVASMTRIGPVMLTASLVAALSFFSLVVFPITVIRTFGIFAGAGILSALVIEMTFTPALRSILPPPRAVEDRREREQRLWDRFTSWVARMVLGTRRPAILAGALLFTLICLVGAARVVTDTTYPGYFSPALPFQREQRALNERLGGTFTLLVLVDGGEPDALKRPDVLRAMEETQRFLDGQEHVGKTISLADFVKRMNLAMHSEDPAYDRIPDDRNLIAQYLLLYSMSGEPDDFDTYVDPTYRSAVIRVLLDTISSAYVHQLITKLDTVVGTTFPTGVRVRIGGNVAQSAALNDVMARGKLLNIIQIGTVIFFISSLVFRSCTAGVLVLTPLVLTVLAAFGLMGWTGIRLNVVTAVISAMAVGVGADYAIYLIYRLREELAREVDEATAVRTALTTAGKAILFVALAVAGGYGVLLLSYDFYPHVWLAILIVSAMLVSSLSAVTVLPAIILTLRPRCVFDARRGPTSVPAPRPRGEVPPAR